jgi:L-asparaginase
MVSDKEAPLPGPYKPTLILHGGAGNITRKNLPPALYAQYEASLLKDFDSTREWLYSGASALDAAVHAVSLMEDDPLFNCGRGSVFTEKGTIEMEASVMVASVDPDRGGRDDASMVADQKRGASVSLVKNTRYPIRLAREVLLVKPSGKANSMHCQLSGAGAEEWGWKARGLERKDDDWFWTERRWAEHLRELQQDRAENSRKEVCAGAAVDGGRAQDDGDALLPSQGTVGAVCMDSWGDVCVATSTGGLTNKRVGRIGDTPTLGAGFWAEAWEEPAERSKSLSAARNPVLNTEDKKFATGDRLAKAMHSGFEDLLQACLPQISSIGEQDEFLPSIKVGILSGNGLSTETVGKQPQSPAARGMIYPNHPTSARCRTPHRRRAIALSGTGNGDTFLRTAASRTTAAICRFSNPDPLSNSTSLATAVNLTAGPNGEMQRSAGDRWKVTGEGQAGMIGIEIYGDEHGADEETAGFKVSQRPRRTGNAVFDFNCGGLWRVWMDERTGRGKVMVFRQEYHSLKHEL